MNDRYDRQIGLFGNEGQNRVARARVVILGVGGLGMPLAQQLAYLGVTSWAVADSDLVDATSLNRLVGATTDDIDIPKVAIAERLIRAVHPDADITLLPVDLPHESITAAVADATVVIGCFDKETPRLVATELCSTTGVRYIDLATEVIPTLSGPVYGGRIVIATDGTGCLSCLDVLDTKELAREHMTDEQLRADDVIYGVDRKQLRTRRQITPVLVCLISRVLLWRRSWGSRRRLRLCWPRWLRCWTSGRVGCCWGRVRVSWGGVGSR